MSCSDAVGTKTDVQTAISNPIDALTTLFHESGGNNFPARVQSHFSSIFSDENAFKTIPSLNIAQPASSHPDRTLVRFRAMVQDTSHSPEMYLSQLPNGGCGGWGIDHDASTHSIDYEHLKECHVVWGVSVPGQATWAGASDSTVFTHVSSLPHKYPISESPHIGAQLKIYHTADAEKMKATDIYDFVGVLTHEHLHNSHFEENNGAVVPTLHVVYHLALPITIVSRSYPSVPPTQSVDLIREDLITWIADEALEGDRTTAEWVLLCAISHTHSRTPPILASSLTISRFPSPPSNSNNRTPVLAHVLSLLFPTVTPLLLSIHTINNTSFYPESSGDDLQSGWLQLPKGSLCVMTESGVTEGSLFEKGLMNLRAVQEVMNSQELSYVFPFSTFSFDTDVAFLVLAEGRKSAFFQTSFSVALTRASELTSSAALYKPASEISIPPADKLEAFRNLVGGAKIGNATVADGTAKIIEHDFVNDRRNKGFTPDDLVSRMTVARLMALSLHETEVNADIWKRAKTFDDKRREKAKMLSS
ncbi:hypothetical protein FISHEDRAFT_53642 [Fistulina hepatica ATCC 64428]|nr:hypothetical protein FISHEDRAFT_53642 [Fistulina hepatica ATCC 64428]